MPLKHIHFITGRLAENALRKTLDSLTGTLDDESRFNYSIQVLPITVAALMTPVWIARHLEIPESATHLMLPGYCNGDLAPLRSITSLPIDIGPKDLRQLPHYFGTPSVDDDYGQYDIDIIAEINFSPRYELSDFLETAAQLRAEGADIIDVGCEPGFQWTDAGRYVAALKSEGHRVSIDSFDIKEIESAVSAGAELVLSVNSTNREAAPDWGCEVVTIPDDIRNILSMEDSIEWLAQKNVPLRIDPVLEPVGLGFAASLHRYQQSRDRWPEAEILMGIGNLTELTDVDSAGINVILLAICQELGIRSVLTTQVINWARSSVRECDIARKLVAYSLRHGIPPKRLTEELVILRDANLLEFGTEQLQNLANAIKDRNYRIVAESGQIHLLGKHSIISGEDPFAIFDQLESAQPKNLDPSHAFYLGFEMCKAQTALQLGKQYTQDESLNWGFLTVPETTRHRLKKRKS